jgi:hypothetical protein
MKQIKNLITRFWRGDVSLPVSYLIFCIFIPAILVTLIDLTIKKGSNLEILLSLIGLKYLVFVFIGTWRSASDYIKKGKSVFWGYLTKVILIISSLPLIPLIIDFIKFLLV